MTRDGLVVNGLIDPAKKSPDTLTFFENAFNGFTGFCLRPLSKNLKNLLKPNEKSFAARTILVQAQLPGASPDTVASSLAEPLERHLGQIAHVTEMTSASNLGQTRIILQFDIGRDIDGAARDVQAAINAARADLPTNLPTNPTYRKINPADAPILILTLTSKTKSRGQMYDVASNILQQRLSQLDGIGQVFIFGGALPAVRVELNPHALAKYGVGLEDVRAALASANANSPKGAIEDGQRHLQIYTNDQATRAADYIPLSCLSQWRSGPSQRRRRCAGLGRGRPQSGPFRRPARPFSRSFSGSLAPTLSTRSSA